MSDTYKSVGTNPINDPFSVHECSCANPKLIPSSLRGRVYSCTKCGGKVSIPGAIRHAKGVLFAMQVEDTIKNS